MKLSAHVVLVEVSRGGQMLGTYAEHSGKRFGFFDPLRRHVYDVERVDVDTDAEFRFTDVDGVSVRVVRMTLRLYKHVAGGVYGAPEFKTQEELERFFTRPLNERFQ